MVQGDPSFIGAVGYNYCITTHTHSHKKQNTTKSIKNSGGAGAGCRAHLPSRPPHRAERPSAFSASRCAIVLTFHSSSPLVLFVPVNINYYNILLSFFFYFYWSDVLSQVEPLVECKMWNINLFFFASFMPPPPHLFFLDVLSLEKLQHRHRNKQTSSFCTYIL